MMNDPLTLLHNGKSPLFYTYAGDFSANKNNGKRSGQSACLTKLGGLSILLLSGETIRAAAKNPEIPATENVRTFCSPF